MVLLLWDTQYYHIGPRVECGRQCDEKPLPAIKYHENALFAIPSGGNFSTERSIGSVKTLIRSMCQARGIKAQDWDLLLDEATLAYNATVNKSMGISPFECMLGSRPHLPLDQRLGMDPRPQRADVSVIRANAEKNRAEAQVSYKKRLDDIIRPTLQSSGLGTKS